MHLIVDGYGSDSGILQDEEAIYEFLDHYPSRIGMTKIAPPHVFRYVGNKDEDWGISGIVFIAESHISIHTFVDYSFVNIDVFSCKDFNADQVVKDLRQKLQLNRMRSYLADRSWKSFDQPSELAIRKLTPLSVE